MASQGSSTGRPGAFSPLVNLGIFIIWNGIFRDSNTARRQTVMEAAGLPEIFVPLE